MKRPTRQTAIAAVAAAALVLAGGGAWWRWTHRYLDVPGCQQALTALQQRLGGTWTLDPVSASSDEFPERADCHYDYIAAGSTTTGTIWISMNGHTDAGHRAGLLADSPCSGTEEPVDSGGAYTAARQCVETVAGTARVALLTTTGDRYTRVGVDLTGTDATPAALSAVARDTARACMDAVSILPADR